MKKNLKNQLVIFLIISLPFLTGGCNLSGETIKGDGNVVTETFNVDDFHTIELSGMFNVILEPGNDLTVTIETDENLQDLISVNSQNNILSITTEREAVLRPTKMEIHIIYPQLQRIEVGGACKISSPRILEAEEMEFDISGAASIDLELEVRDLSTRIAGAGDIDLQGFAERHTVELAGASNLDARRLETQITDIALSGAGSAHVNASQELKAAISGVGSIKYYGNPEKTSFEKTGIGSIRQAN